MIGNVKVKILGKEYDVVQGTMLCDISKICEKDFDSHIILAKVNGKYHELTYVVNEPCEVEFLTYSDREANRVYVSGLISLMMFTAKYVLEDNELKVLHSIDKGLYIKCTKPIQKEDITVLKQKMKDVVNLDLKFEKIQVDRKEAIKYFEEQNDKSKSGILKYTTDSVVPVYKLANSYDFFFSMMPYSTGALANFDLKYLDENGFVLLYRTVYMKDNQIKSYQHHPMIFEVFKEYHGWANIMNIDYVSSLNDFVSRGNAGNLIRIDETLQSNKLLSIAREIYDKKDKVKIVLIAGPSSSGKTTACNKLCMFLESFGIHPKTLSMDNYFVEREKTPRDENGDYDFESVNCVDLDKFDKQMCDLLDGKEVVTPKFNFYIGKPEPGETIKLGKDDIIIIEGIHGLNPVLLPNVPKKAKYKIYVSPLTGLNLDNSNRISTTDNRLLRRMIRDYVNRGYSVEETIMRWPSVRIGEERNIFPFQDEADVIFNTALIYEIGVLKTYVEPLLYSVSVDSPYYDEARRLLIMLRQFLPIPSDDIPKDSLLREFIGGSCFKQ